MWTLKSTTSVLRRRFLSVRHRAATLVVKTLVVEKDVVEKDVAEKDVAEKDVAIVVMPVVAAAGARRGISSGRPASVSQTSAGVAWVTCEASTRQEMLLIVHQL
jgi:hypothetical protein